MRCTLPAGSISSVSRTVWPGRIEQGVLERRGRGARAGPVSGVVAEQAEVTAVPASRQRRRRRPPCRRRGSGCSRRRRRSRARCRRCGPARRCGTGSAASASAAKAALRACRRRRARVTSPRRRRRARPAAAWPGRRRPAGRPARRSSGEPMAAKVSTVHSVESIARSRAVSALLGGWRAPPCRAVDVGLDEASGEQRRVLRVARECRPAGRRRAAAAGRAPVSQSHRVALIESCSSWPIGWPSRSNTSSASSMWSGSRKPATGVTAERGSQLVDVRLGRGGRVVVERVRRVDEPEQPAGAFWMPGRSRTVGRSAGHLEGARRGEHRRRARRAGGRRRRPAAASIDRQRAAEQRHGQAGRARPVGPVGARRAGRTPDVGDAEQLLADAVEGRRARGRAARSRSARRSSDCSRRRRGAAELARRGQVALLLRVQPAVDGRRERLAMPGRRSGCVR